jgi:hypothetical protein
MRKHFYTRLLKRLFSQSWEHFYWYCILVFLLSILNYFNERFFMLSMITSFYENFFHTSKHISCYNAFLFIKYFSERIKYLNI